MTVDELLQQLMKIKEVYPDSGSWPLVADFNELDSDVDIRKIRIIGKSVVFED
jgi:hypothetical protein